MRGNSPPPKATPPPWGPLPATHIRAQTGISKAKPGKAGQGNEYMGYSNICKEEATRDRGCEYLKDTFSVL